MEAPVYSPADAEEITSNDVKAIKADDIDATFRSDCIGMQQTHCLICFHDPNN